MKWKAWRVAQAGRRGRIAYLCSRLLVHGALIAAAGDAVALDDAAALDDPATLPAVTVSAGRDTSENGYQARRASVATRTETPLVDVPQTINVVTQQSLEDRQPDSLADALATVPGVRVGNTLGGTLDAVVKRGFGSNRDNSILRDGMQSVQPRNFTPTTERIEVLKGPASMLYGIQDPGGVINVVTKKPLRETERSISAFVSSWGGGGARLDLTGPIGVTGLAYRLIADHQRYNYWRNFGYVRQDTVAPSFAWYGRDTSVLLQYEHMSYAVPLDRGTVIDTRTGNPVAAPKARRFDEPYNLSAGRSDAVNLRVDHKLGEHWLLHAGYGFNRTYYNDWQARILGVDFDTGFATRRVDSTQNGAQSVHNLTLNLEGTVRWAGVLHEVLAGVDSMRNYRVLADLHRGRSNSRFNVYEPVYGQLPQVSRLTASDSDSTQKLISRGAFAQDAIHLGDRWIVLGGLRYEHYQELTGRGRPFVVGTQVSGAKVVPRAGAVFKIAPEWSLYSSYSESFRPNVSITQPIGVLPPEQGQAWEIGSRFATRRLSATLALFDIRKRNVLTIETIDGVNVARNAGRARSRGIEVEVTGRITDKWSMLGGYAYTEARYANDPKTAGNPLPNTPKHAASLYLTRDFGIVELGAVAGRLRAGAGARVFSGLLVGDGSGRVYHLPYGRVVDTFVAWNTRIGGRDIDWQFNAKNLFNTTYYASYCCTGTPIVAIGEGRQFMLNAKLEF